MAHPHIRGRKHMRDNLLTITTFALGVGLCIWLGSPLYWRVVGGAAHGAAEPCARCMCDCVNVESEVSVYEDLADLKAFILPNCGKDDPDMQEELNKSKIQLLEEELELREVVSMEVQVRIHAAITKSISKGNQRFEESRRCDREMVALEDARERAEADLGIQRRNTRMWESRAQALGWKEKVEPDKFKSSKDPEGDLENTNAASVENDETIHFSGSSTC